MVKFEELNFNNIDFDSENNISYVEFNGAKIAVKKKLDMNNIMLLSSYVLAEAEDPKAPFPPGPSQRHKCTGQWPAVTQQQPGQYCSDPSNSPFYFINLLFTNFIN